MEQPVLGFSAMPGVARSLTLGQDPGAGFRSAMISSRLIRHFGDTPGCVMT